MSSTSFDLTQVSVTSPAGQIEFCSVEFIRFGLKLTPAELLEPGTYEISVSGLADIAGNAAPAVTKKFVIEDNFDFRGPRILQTFPGSHAETPLNPVVSAEFSEPLDPGSIFSPNVTPTGRGGPGFRAVTGTPKLEGGNRRVVVTFDGSLAVSTRQTVSFDNVEDPTGNRAGTRVNLDFQSGLFADLQPPVITSVSPVQRLTFAPLNTAVEVVFNEIVQPAAGDAITMTGGGSAVEGELKWDGPRLTFTPYSPLEGSTAYTIRVESIRDLAGNLLPAPIVQTFTTAADRSVDNTRPTVSFNVGKDTFGVPRDTALVAEFSERIRPETLEVTLRDQRESTTIPLTLELQADNETLTATPLTPLVAKRRYLFKVGAVKDLAFNAISSDAFTLFETGAGFEDDSPPTLVAQYPPAGSVNIPTNVQVLLLFDEPLDARTVSEGVQILGSDGTDAATQHLSQFVSQNMGGLYQIGVFGRWPPSQTLTVQIPALKDLSGAVRSPSQFSFATGPDPANVRPQVTSIVPADGARDVPLTASVQVTVAPPALAGSVFQESSVVTITPVGGEPITQTARVSYTANTTTFTITPVFPLLPDTTYEIEIFRFFGLSSGGGSDRVTTQFTTSPSADVEPPSVIIVTPGDRSGGVTPSMDVTLTFSEAMNPLTLTTQNIGLFVDGDPIDVMLSISLDATVVTLRPNKAYPPSAKVELAVTSGAEDFARNPAVPFTSSFDVLPTAPHGPALVSLRPFSTTPGGLPLHLFFDQPADPATFFSGILVAVDGVLESGVFEVLGDGRTVKFSPSNPFPASGEIRVFLMPTLANVAGIPRERIQESGIRTGSGVSFPFELFTPGCLGRRPSFEVDAPVNAVFRFRSGQPLDAATVNGASVQFTSAGVEVPGVVTLEPGGQTIRFSPAQPLLLGEAYEWKFTLDLRSSHGSRVFRSERVCTYRAVDADTTPLTVTRLVPDNGEVDVARNTVLRARFDDRIGQVSLPSGRVALTERGDPQNPIPTKLQPLGDLIIFTPHTLLDSGRTYDVLIEGFDDQTNRTMVPFSYSFTVADEIDLDPPVVEMVSPTGLNTPVNVVPAVRFSEPLDTTSLTQLGISAPGTFGLPVSSFLGGDNRTAYIRPDEDLQPASRHWIRVEGVRDLAGNQLLGRSQIQFDTGSHTDNSALSITGSFPADGTAGLPLNAEPTFLVNQPLDPATLKPPFVRLFQASADVPFLVKSSANDRLIRIKPRALLEPSTSYTLQVSGLQNLTGGEMTGSLRATFSTGIEAVLPELSIVQSTPPDGATSVSLGTAIQVDFNRPLNPNTVLSESVMLSGPDAPGLVLMLSLNNTRLTATPRATLNPNSFYRLAIRPELTDAAGISLRRDSDAYVAFTTGP